MVGWFIDSNVFLRFFAKDDPEQSQRAGEIFHKAREERLDLYCGPPVFFEVAWVLRAAFKVPAEEILNILESMLAIPELTVLDAGVVTKAINLARKGHLSFSDSYIAVAAKELNLGVATFNRRHFVKTGVALYAF